MSKTKTEKARRILLDRIAKRMRAYRAARKKLASRGMSEKQIAVHMRRRAKKPGRKVEYTGDPLLDARREWHRLAAADYRRRKASGDTRDLRKQPYGSKYQAKARPVNGFAPSRYLVKTYGENLKAYKPVDELTRLKRLIYQYKKAAKQVT